MHPRLAAILRLFVHPVVAIGGALVVAAAVVGMAWQASTVIPTGQYAAAITAPIMAVGGASSDFSFQVSGQIASIPVSIGKKVSIGETLIVLDHASLLATRAGAAANLEAAVARLAAIKAGTRPEQIAVNQTTVTQSQESLRDAVRSAYINADDAIHNKTDQFFTSPRTSSAAFSFTVPDQTLESTVQAKRVDLESVLSVWGTLVNSVDFATSDPLSDAKLAQTSLAQVSAFLDSVATVLAGNPSSTTLSPTVFQGYQTSINAARLNISASISAVTSATTALRGAQGTLLLAQAGPTVNDVAGAQAAVDAAQASLSGIDVALRQSTLVAPINGTVTALNAHVGQTVTPGQALISIESSGGENPNALVVPKSGVIESDGQTFVYVKSGTGAPTKTLVVTGLVSANGMTEILRGLSVGQEILTFGTSGK